MRGTRELLFAPTRLLSSSPGLTRARWRAAQRQWRRQLSLHTPKHRPTVLASPRASLSRRHQSTASSTSTSVRASLYGALTVLVLGFGCLYVTDTRASVHQWLVVPALRVLYPDPEDAHHAGIHFLKGLYSFNLHPRERGNKDQELGDLRVEVFGHVLDNPTGTSAGIDKNAEVPSALLALGPAIVEVGGVTPLPQPGNEKPRVFRIPSQNALINRYGLNSAGAEHVAVQLRERVREFAYANGLGLGPESERIVLDGEAGVPPGSLVPGKLLAVQIAKNKTTPDHDIDAVARDYVTCVNRLAKYADILVVNVSSPNTPGLRDLQATAPLTAILTAVVDAAKSAPRKSRPPVMVKVSPDEDSDAQVEGICSAVWSSGVDGVIVGNTTKSRPDPIPKGYIMPAKDVQLLSEVGGYSGPQMFERTLDLVKRYRARLDEGPLDSLPSSPNVETPSATSSSTSKSPEGLESNPVDTSVQRDVRYLKPLTPEAEEDSHQPLLQLPERHSEPQESSSAPVVKPAPAPYPSLGPITPPPSPAAPSPEAPEPVSPPSSSLDSAAAAAHLPAPSSEDASSDRAANRSKDFEPKVIFATGGITNGEQCLQILNAGASVCQVYTAMMYGGVGTVTRIKGEIREGIHPKGKDKQN